MTNHQTTQQQAKTPASVGERFAEAISPMVLTVDAAVAIADAIHQPVERFLIGTLEIEAQTEAEERWAMVYGVDGNPNLTEEERTR